MDVVLKSDVKKLGKRGEVKRVSDGYAQNFLFPKGLAEPANKASLSRVKQEEEKSRASVLKRKEQEERTLSTLRGKCVTIRAKSEGRKLFGSIHERDIVRALEGSGVSGMSEKQIIMEQPIRNTGEFQVVARIGSGVAKFTVSIEGEERG